MRFGPLEAQHAEGGVLAHSLRLPSGRFLRKGRVLDGDDVTALVEGGIARVTVAVLEAEDVAEDEAAETVAQALAGPDVEVRRPGTGRCNLVAGRGGLVHLDVDRIQALNRVHESVTVATLPPWAPVRQGTLVATVKIIPFAVPAAALSACLESIHHGTPAMRVGRPPLRVAAFESCGVSLIQTRLPGTSQKVLERSRDTMTRRLAALGSRLDSDAVCDHELDAVTTTLLDALRAGSDLVLVLGASATGDRGDVIPRAVERAGGQILHLGIPVDPGNLTLLARHEGTPVLGVPGCARSIRRNGFDMVLEHVLAGRMPSEDDIADMAVGGLLKEPPGRLQPRRGPSGEPQGAHRFAAVVLAAGGSSRMGDTNKLLANVGGRPIVRHVVEVLVDLPLEPVVVVVGHQAEAVRAALAGLPVRFVTHGDWEAGMGTSVSAGVAATADQADAVLVALGDMPWLSADDVRALLDAFDPRSGRGICVPVRDRKRGNPVLWASRYFAALQTLEGDVGGRHLLNTFVDDVCEVAVSGEGVLMDVDTPEALEAARRRETPP
jgi:molybdenum cofactor cytidylyltransferase